MFDNSYYFINEYNDEEEQLTTPEKIDKNLIK